MGFPKPPSAPRPNLNRYCARCGHAAPPRGRFCSRCGFGLNTQPPAPPPTNRKPPPIDTIKWIDIKAHMFIFAVFLALLIIGTALGSFFYILTEGI